LLTETVSSLQVLLRFSEQLKLVRGLRLILVWGWVILGFLAPASLAISEGALLFVVWGSLPLAIPEGTLLFVLIYKSRVVPLVEND